MEDPDYDYLRGLLYDRVLQEETNEGDCIRLAY